MEIIGYVHQKHYIHGFVYYFYKLSKLYSNSLLILGIIEDLSITNIKISSSNLYRQTESKGLYESIKEKGLLQPIIVRPINDHYEIIAGNRRYDACKKLGWKKIICHIVEATDKEAFEISLIENIQRKNLDLIEEANYFRLYVRDHGWGGISELALKIGKSVAYVDRRLKLLELPDEIINLVSSQCISPTAAEELIPLKDGKKQSEIANMIKDKGISSREIRNIVRDLKNDDSNGGDYPSCPKNIDRRSLIEETDRKAQKVFDKSIMVLKIASQKLAQSISEIEENWIIYELLMQNKCVIDRQIDILIKEKRKM